LARVVTGALGALLLVVAVASTLQAGRSAAQDSLDSSLQSRAEAGAATLQEYLDRATSINLMLANDSALRAYAEQDRSQPATPAEARTSRAASQALAYVEQLYPARSARHAWSTARAPSTRGSSRASPRRPTSCPRRRRGSPYFAPTLALPPGHVHQTSPVPLRRHQALGHLELHAGLRPERRTWGLVQFEMPLDSFRTAALDGDLRAGFSAAVLDDRTGRVLLESGDPLYRAASGSSPPGRDLSPGLRTVLDGAGQLPATVDGRRVVTAGWTLARTTRAPGRCWCRRLRRQPAGRRRSARRPLPLRWQPCSCSPSPA
jgi:hypothetical protein